MYWRRTDVRNQQGIKLFFVLFICTVFIYSFSHFGALAYNAMTTDSDQFSVGTTIGSLDVTAKSKAKALTLLTEALQKWRTETTIQIQFKENTASINAEIFQFELENTIQSAQSGQPNPVIASIQKEDLNNILKQLSSQLVLEDSEQEKLQNELLSYATTLSTGNHQVTLEKLLNAKTANDALISEKVMELGNVSVEIIDWIEQLSPINVPAQSQVSFLKIIEDSKLTNMPFSTQSMIATGIYQTILPTNFSILERHTGQVLPDYVGLGFEAKVNFENQLNFVFANPNETDYILELKWESQTLTIQLKGSPFLNKYSVEQSGKQEFKPKTIIQYSPLLLPNQTMVKTEGKAGSLIKVYRQVYGENGAFLRKEFISEDYYSPLERIEIYGLKSSPTNGINSTPTDPSGTEQPVADSSSAAGTANTTTPPSTVENPDDLWGKQNESLK